MSTLTSGNVTVSCSLSADTSGNLVFQSGGNVTAMTIDSSQNVGIGTSSPSYRLDVQRTAANGTGVLDVLRLRSTGDSAGDGPRLLMTCGNSTTGGAGIGAGGVALNSADLLFYAGGNTERARIDSSGNLLVGTTSTTFSEKFSVAAGGSGINTALFRFTTTDDRDVVIMRHARASGGTNAGMINFQNASGSTVGLIYSNGSNTVYATSSDYRLKENIQPMTGALARVAALQPCTYVWKEGGEIGEGFIAHELAEVCPQAVAGEKDAVNEDGSIKPQGIDTSFLVATLTAAIQEQQAMIEELKAKVAALEAA